MYTESDRKYQREYYRKNKAKRLQHTNAWKERNKERVLELNKKSRARNREKNRAKWLKRKFGISVEQYNKIVAAHGNKCCVCKKPFQGTEKKGPHLDHCHSTGVIRGILCHKCNIAEAYLGTPENALNLYKYMLKNELFYQGKN